MQSHVQLAAKVCGMQQLHRELKSIVAHACSMHLAFQGCVTNRCSSRHTSSLRAGHLCCNVFEHFCGFHIPTKALCTAMSDRNATSCYIAFINKREAGVKKMHMPVIAACFTEISKERNIYMHHCHSANFRWLTRSSFPLHRNGKGMFF